MSLIRHLIPPPGPIRVLAASGLARSIGNGMLLSVSVLYFLRSVGIPAEQLGLGLTIAAGFGMLASVPAGHTADVLGARTTSVLFAILQGLMICGYVLVGGFGGFVVAVSLVVMFESASRAARGALVAAVTAGGDRVRARAYLRSINNVGVSVGALFGAVALHYNTRAVYIGLLVACGVVFVAAGLIYLLLAPIRLVPKPDDGPRWVVLRDKPFVAVASLNSILVMNGGMLTVALPIWIAERTSAPVWLFSGILLLNTVTVVLLQVRVSQGAHDVAGGARALRRAGVLLAVSCGLFALAAGGSVWLAVSMLLAGALVHVFGELLYAAGAWALSYELAPDHAQGQYQGLFGMADQLGTALTPVVVTTVIIGYGWAGWLVFAVILLAAGALAPVTAWWAQRTRSRYAPTVIPSPESPAQRIAT